MSSTVIDHQETSPRTTYSNGGFQHTQEDTENEKTPLLGAVPTVNDVSESGSGDEKANEFSFSRLPSRSKYTLLLCSLCNLFVGCSFSILAPFFPKEADKKGLSTTVVGLIFSTFELVIFLSSPVFGNYLTRIGAKFMFTSGICVGGACSVLFGVLDKSPPGVPFMVLCFACRSLEALAMSAFLTASFAILSNEFPNHVATVVGLSETASGIGMMLGPAVGGALYQLNGYGTPFFVMGSLIILVGFIQTAFLPDPEDVQTKRKGSILSFFKSPLALVSMLSVMMCALGVSFIDPTLAKHLDPFDLSTAVVGLIFVIGPFFYSICTPFFGYLVDNKGFVGSLIVIGHLLYGLSFFFIGPSPWVTPFLPNQLWIVIMGQVFLGLGIGCIAIPNMKCLVLGAMAVGFEDNLDTYAIVSGLFNSMFCLGAFMGPTIGGVLVEHYGFNISATLVGLVNIAV